MSNSFTRGAASALSAVLALTLAPTESLAGVMNVPERSIIAPSSSVEQAHYRRHHHYRHYYRYWRPRHYWRPHRHYYRYYRYGYDPAAAMFGAAALGMIAAAASRPRYSYGWGYPSYGYGWGGPVYWGGGWGGYPGYRRWGW